MKKKLLMKALAVDAFDYYSVLTTIQAYTTQCTYIAIDIFVPDTLLRVKPFFCHTYVCPLMDQLDCALGSSLHYFSSLYFQFLTCVTVTITVTTTEHNTRAASSVLVSQKPTLMGFLSPRASNLTNY